MAKKKKVVKKKQQRSFDAIHPMVRGAIRDCVLQALHAEPKEVRVLEHASFTCYEIDGIVYGEGAAVQKILGKYSWWNGSA